MMNNDLIDCLNDIIILNEKAISIFVGAGLSISCGMKKWKDLVEPYAKALGISVEEIPYTRIMQYALSEKAKYSRFLLQLEKEIEGAYPQEAHRLIARLNIPRIWTTNYDGLLERAYSEERISFQVVATDDDIFNLDYRSNQIVKMHGSLTSVCSAIPILKQA